MSTWKPKISRGGPLLRGPEHACGICEAPILKGQEKSVILWTRGKQGCTTRRHAACEDDREPSEAEIATHTKNQQDSA